MGKELDVSKGYLGQKSQKYKNQEHEQEKASMQMVQLQLILSLFNGLKPKRILVTPLRTVKFHVDVKE